MKHYLLLFTAFLMISCSSDNIPDEEKTLMWYQKASSSNRTALLERIISKEQWDKADLPHYIQCMSEYAIRDRLFSVVGVIEDCHDEAKNDRQRFTHHVDELLVAKQYHLDAAILCEEKVKEQLVSPSSANFGWLARQEIYKGNHRFLVKSYVESQNAFGVEIKNNWKCDIQYHADGSDRSVLSNWTVHELEIW